jgi:alkanesulfonate monooxygenase SsuD/methylene tetrahydromethanopterin reductase-like flavin-dependent oxidoreductase (luciferase family)
VSWILPSVAAKVNYGLGAIALPPDQQEEVRLLRAAYDYRDHQTAGGHQLKYVRRWMVDRFAILGPPAAIAERLSALAEAGVDEVILGPGSAPLESFLPAFASQVRPLVRLAPSRGSVLG